MSIEYTAFLKHQKQATQDLKRWAIDVVSTTVRLIPDSIDKKFDEYTSDHRWMRFQIRFKLVLFSL